MIECTCGILKRRQNIVPLKIGQFGEHLFHSQARSQQVKHINDTNSQPSDTRSPATLLRV